MPELPEVETVRLGLLPVLEGARILRAEVRRKDLRRNFPVNFAKRLTGRTVIALRRRAKYLLAELDDGNVLLMHLGMSGSFRIEGKDTPGDYYHAHSRRPEHDHVVFELSSGVRVIYNDPRRFGMMDLISREELAVSPELERLGPEPLGEDFTPEALALRLGQKKTPLKAALLDQSLVAGLGNIYVCEALWRAALSPRRLAATLVLKSGSPAKMCIALVASIRAVLAEAIDAGGSSLRDHARADGSLGDFQHRFSVYDREGKPCPRRNCRGIIARIVQSGRSTFFCPSCQK